MAPESVSVSTSWYMGKNPDVGERLKEKDEKRDCRQKLRRNGKSHRKKISLLWKKKMWWLRLLHFGNKPTLSILCQEFTTVFVKTRMTSPHEGKTMCHPETPGTSLRTCPWCNGIRDISRVIVGEVFGTVPSFRRYTYLKSFYLPMRKVSSPKRQRDSRVSTYYLRFSDSWDQRMSFLFPFFLSCHFSGQTHYKCFFVFTY